MAITKPKVSVCVVTFNHEKYIRQCLQSIVEQVTNFDIEVIVGNDNSTDRTLDVVREFSQKFPELITEVSHKKNIGAVENLIFVYKLAKGHYIAHMDGDDHMLPGKLQRQFDILEKHSNCSICSHDMLSIDRRSIVIANSFQRHGGGVFKLHDLYERLPFFAHSSKMFVNNLDFCSALTNESIDIEIHVAQAKIGDIFHIDEPLGAYRVATGISQVCGRVNPLLPAATRRVYIQAMSDVGLRVQEREAVLGYFARSILNYAYQSALVGNRRDCRKYAVESARIKIISPTQLFLYAAGFLPVCLRQLANIRANRKRKKN